MGWDQHRVGNGAAYSDSLGYYRAWDAVPFEPVLVRADSRSFESPLWVPGFELAAVVPSPNRLTMVDIPILRGVVLEGRVVSAATGSGLSGVRLQLRERRSGASRTITTFNDGSFYVLGITPGDYVLEVDPRVLETLGMTATPAGFVVQPGSDGVDPVQLRLVDVP